MVVANLDHVFGLEESDVERIRLMMGDRQLTLVTTVRMELRCLFGGGWIPSCVWL